MRTTSIVVNLRSSKASTDRTPVEIFSGCKQSVTDLRIFGSTVFVKDNSSNLGNLDAHSEECILLSHDDRAKSYRCFQTSKQRVLISRNVRIIKSSHVDVEDPSDSDLIKISSSAHPLAFAPLPQVPNQLPVVIGPATPAPTAVTEFPVNSASHRSPSAGSSATSGPRLNSWSNSQLPGSSAVTVTLVSTAPLDSLSQVTQLQHVNQSAQDSLPRCSTRTRQSPQHLSDYVCQLELD